MRIKNRLAAHLSDRRLLELAEFAAGGIPTHDLLVEAGFTSGLDGHAAGLFRASLYGWDAKRHPDLRFYLRAALPEHDLRVAGSHWPCRTTREPGGPGRSHLRYLAAYAPLPTVTVHDLDEELVYILAHEFAHLAQWRADQAAGWRLYRRLDGSHDEDRIEREAEARGQARLAAFRAARRPPAEGARD